MFAFGHSIKKYVVGALTISMLSLSVVPFDAEAKRLGGSKSFGRQSSQPVSPSSPTNAQRAPTQQAAPATPPSQPAAQPARNRWMGPLAGLAAGLGIAALLSHFGMGEAFASMMSNMLLIGLAVFAVMWLIRKFRGTPAQQAPQPAYQGAGYASQPPVQAPVQSNNAFKTLQSEPSAMSQWGGGAAAPALAAAAAPAMQIPAGFDVEGFLGSAKQVFVRMQNAFDASDINALREFTADDVLAELKSQIAERGASTNKTDVVTLKAELIGFETDVDEYIASVHFSGMIREDAGAAAEPFEEIWNLSRPVSGQGGWLLAGIQNLN